MIVKQVFRGSCPILDFIFSQMRIVNEDKLL